MSTQVKDDRVLTLAEALAAGYCITSRKHRNATRIDRLDWKEHMARQHAPWDPEGEGAAWVAGLRGGAGDQYRRVHSRDTICVPAEWLSVLPSSDGGANWFQRGPGDQQDAPVPRYTGTGRSASQNGSPSLQNLPVRTPEGQRIRRAFLSQVQVGMGMAAGMGACAFPDDQLWG